ncbi:hypothetical protein J4218_01420 [Candidatus Pacearchaeota archaeon]|nr:hypothetical protein [Candidatus Pacearchaeota archaeon]
MKKLETKREIEKKSKRNQLIIGIILVGLMILSTGGYAIMNNEGNSGSSGSVEYKGVKFIRDGIYWKFILQNQEFATEYNAQELENITVPIKTKLTDYNEKVLYFVTESGEPNNEIYRNVYPFILKQNGACLENSECKNDLPTKSCSNENIIIIKEPLNNESEGISQDRNCVFIRAYYNNQTKFADAFLFKLLNV